MLAFLWPSRVGLNWFEPFFGPLEPVGRCLPKPVRQHSTSSAELYSYFRRGEAPFMVHQGVTWHGITSVEERTCHLFLESVTKLDCIWRQKIENKRFALFSFVAQRGFVVYRMTGAARNEPLPYGLPRDGGISVVLRWEKQGCCCGCCCRFGSCCCCFERSSRRWMSSTDLTRKINSTRPISPIDNAASVWQDRRYEWLNFTTQIWNRFIEKPRATCCGRPTERRTSGQNESYEFGVWNPCAL